MGYQPLAVHFFRLPVHLFNQGLVTMKGNFYENERVALFIDGANLYSAARSLGFDIDYRRLLKVFREKGRLVRAYYYTALVEDQEYSPIRPLIDWLDYNGYTMVTKPTKEFTDAMGRLPRVLRDLQQLFFHGGGIVRAPGRDFAHDPDFGQAGAVERFQGPNEPADDVTIVAIRRKPAAG